MEQYIFEGNRDDQELGRLRLIEQALDAESIARLQNTGVRQAWRCLELGAGAGSIAQWMGCVVGERGQVVAVDIKTNHLQHLSMGNNLLRLKVFPVAPNADQKVALTYTSVASRDGDLVEYVYPLKTDGKATRTLEKFSIQATIKSQHPIVNVYSPTHSVTLKKNGDREVAVSFEREQGLLDKDFQLFYSQGDKDVGLTSLAHRPVSSENGYFMFLVSPRVEMSQAHVIPRDMVLVLDTSGSMRGRKMEQARKAMRYCLDNLNTQDRFALIHFATSVNKYKDTLTDASSEQLEQARKWVDQLEATGGRPSTTPCWPLSTFARPTWAGRLPSCSSPTAARLSARPTPTGF